MENIDQGSSICFFLIVAPRLEIPEEGPRRHAHTLHQYAQRRFAISRVPSGVQRVEEKRIISTSATT